MTCHAPIAAKIKGPGAHAPAAQGQCFACHEPHGGTRKALLKQDGNQLCATCHATIGKEGDHVHPPAEEKDCLSCHDPHGGTVAPALRRPVPELCSDCHELDDADLVAKHKGASLAKADCFSCHAPHASKRTGLLAQNAHPFFIEQECSKCHGATGAPGKANLAKPAATLCKTCHEIPKRSGAAVKTGAPAKGAAGATHVHPPAAEGRCTVCHTPHASDRTGLLADSPKRLCVTCHKDVVGSAAMTHGHPPARSGECATCHEPHESTRPALLTQDTSDLCGSCHKELMQRIKTQTPHGPAGKGWCFRCHASHGSNEPGMLKGPIGTVCSSCHDPDTPVMKTKHQGFAIAKADCVSCHDPHAQPVGKKGLLKPALHSPFARNQCSSCHGTEKTGAPAQPVAELCGTCHEPTKAWAKKAVIHAPLKTQDACVSCHAPHAGQARPALKLEGSKLCFTCHNRAMIEGKFTHKALDQGCATCHDPHATDASKLLTQDVDTLCRRCHMDMSKHFHPVSGKKDPRTGDPLTCVGCHTPHSGEFEHLLTHEPKRELCLQCHDTTMKKPGM